MRGQRSKIPSANQFQGQRSRARAYLRLVKRAAEVEIRYAKFRQQYSGYEIDHFTDHPFFRSVGAERFSMIQQLVSEQSIRSEDPLKLMESLEKIIPNSLKINKSLYY